MAVHGEVCAERDAHVVERAATPDRVHLLAWFDPRHGIHGPAEKIEGRSSRLLCQEFGHPRSRLPTVWTNSQFVATVGGPTLEVVKRYVENPRNVEGTPLPPHG